MIKKFLAIVAVLLISCTALFACSSDDYTSIDIKGKQSTDYYVTSNGGNVVVYGNYVYFINGTRGYEDSEGTSNLFGEVVKGGVYRAELLGERTEVKGGPDLFTAQGTTVDEDGNIVLGLKSHVEEDYKRDEVNVVDVQRIAPKTVGTSGYSEGGIYIFGNSMYYASPNNEKDKNGNVQQLKTDFFRMTLDGEKTEKLYTTENNAENAPYSFFVKGNFVYLVVLDGTDLMSIKINKSSGEVEDTVRLKENVTDAVIPTKPVYYDGVSENTVYDFIYFERQATKDDITQVGEILEYIRPDGSSGGVFEEAGGGVYTLETVKDGYLFYRKTDETGYNKLFATNLHENLLNDKAYKAEVDKRLADENDYNDVTNYMDEVLFVDGMDALEVYPFVPGYDFMSENVSTNRVDVITLTSASDDTTSYTMNYYRAGALEKQIATGSAVSFDTVDKESNLYFTADGALKKVSLAVGSDYSATVMASGVVNGTYPAEVVEGYLVYFGSTSDASGYTFFKEVNGLEGNDDPVFVGKLTSSDKASVTEELILIENPVKTQYTVGDSISLKGLVIEQKFYADENGDRPENKVVKNSDIKVTGFDSSTAGDITVTLTYDKKSVTIDMTVLAAEESEEEGCSSTTVWIIVAVAVLLVVIGAYTFYRRRRDPNAAVIREQKKNEKNNK